MIPICFEDKMSFSRKRREVWLIGEAQSLKITDYWFTDTDIIIRFRNNTTLLLKYSSWF